MPFKRTSRRFTKGKRKGQRIYTSPSGRKYSKKQVALYHLTGGFKHMRKATRLKRRKKR